MASSGSPAFRLALEVLHRLDDRPLLPAGRAAHQRLDRIDPGRLPAAVQFHRKLGRVPVRHFAAGFAGHARVISVPCEVGDRVQLVSAHSGHGT